MFLGVPIQDINIKFSTPETDLALSSSFLRLSSQPDVPDRALSLDLECSWYLSTALTRPPILRESVWSRCQNLMFLSRESCQELHGTLLSLPPRMFLTLPDSSMFLTSRHHLASKRCSWCSLLNLNVPLNSEVSDASHGTLNTLNNLYLECLPSVYSKLFSDFHHAPWSSLEHFPWRDVVYPGLDRESMEHSCHVIHWTLPLNDTLSLLSDLGHYSPVYDTLQNVPNSRAWSAKPNVIKNILPHDFTIFVTECDFCHIRTFGGWTFSLLKTGPCFAALCKRLHLEAAVFPSNFSASCSCL